jgi:8-oxo-dGTP pyrophosphatase MutT (NUDIX family)
MAEIWDAYDRQFNKVDGVDLIRGEPIPEGLYHLVGEIIVRHIDGTYLLMRRDLRKHFGGFWELTAGGSALKGEDALDCALRELREETGIVAEGLLEIRRIVSDVHRSIYVEYLCVTDWDKSAITMQEGETIDYRWVEKEEILRMTEATLASSRALAILRETNI